MLLEVSSWDGLGRRETRNRPYPVRSMRSLPAAMNERAASRSGTCMGPLGLCLVDDGLRRTLTTKSQCESLEANWCEM